MKLHHIFYIFGIIFIFASVIYFTYEFILDLPDPIKFVLLAVVTVVVFIIGEFFRGADL